MEYKNCFVPSCNNDTVNSPDKLFVRIRQDLTKQWCEAANTEYSNLYTIYCCEDHFDPEKDLKNFNSYIKNNSTPVLKPTAKLRHITTSQPGISSVNSNSVSARLKKVTKESESKQLVLQPTVPEPPPLLSLRTRKTNIADASTTRPQQAAPTAMDDFSNACRCCLLNVGPLKPLFGSSLDTMLTDLMGFQIKRNDGYPQQICTRCIRNLSSAHNFYQTVNKSHKTVEEKCDVIKRAISKESSADFAIPEVEDKKTRAITAVAVACQTEEMFFQKLMLANVQLSRVEPESYEMPEEEYVMVSGPECEDATETKYVDTEEFEAYEELPDARSGYKCPQCLHVADNQEDLKEHVASHVSGAAGAAEDTTPAQLCNICGQTFKCRTSLYKHLRFHSGHIFQCKYCDKRFAEQSTLKVHLITHSLSNARPFDCSLCERRFSQKAALRKHERAMHAPERPVLSCKQCDSTFLYKISLNKHILRHHSSTRCNLCDSEFSGIKALERHLKTHKQSKTFTYEAEYLEFDDL
ncbi:uncharacterized protein isoform X2 [Choristoneura fumiferana]|uniref:uncharacterized protein isoform X2 n=1 Tax=Choristoneura fumiferana TaxID=7141 RepID=UPI003D15DCB1